MTSTLATGAQGSSLSWLQAPGVAVALLDLMTRVQRRALPCAAFLASGVPGGTAPDEDQLCTGREQERASRGASFVLELVEQDRFIVGGPLVGTGI